MKKYSLVVLLVCSIALSGCVVTGAQLDRKLPRVDAKAVAVELNTIWGTSGSLVEKDVKWDGNRKTVGSSELTITSPAGRYHRIITGATIEGTP